ncbi:MAG: hypothetical protein ACI9XO_000132 [Paraglaciecola sp.]|jgi:hypothetical protein
MKSILLFIFCFLFINTSFGQTTIYSDDFNDGDLAGWSNITDWTNLGTEMKHGLSGVESESYIYTSISSQDLTSENYTWEFCLSNGTWDPSSSNKFWTYLIADANNLSSTGTPNGYAVGVNFTSNSDLLTLYEVSNGSPTAIITSGFNWGISDDVCIKVTRSESGDWELLYNPNGTGEVSGGTVNNTTVTSGDNFGLDFTFSSSRAGLLKMDDVNITKTVPTPNIIVSTISGNTNESGTQATFDVTLNIQPTTPVSINIASSDTGENTVNTPTILTFTNLNFNVPQTVTVTGVDDVLVDGNQTTAISLIVDDAASDDAYDGLSTNVNVINEDNECVITNVSGLASCNGDNAEFAVTWTEVNTSGTIEVDINGIGYQTITNGGTYTIIGPTTATGGVTLTVRDANDNSCLATITVDIPLCPQPVPNLFISEVSDALSFNNEFLEIYNNSGFSVNLTDYKIERLSSAGASEYIFDFGVDETGSGTGSDLVIPANGFLVIARGVSSRTDFEAEFPSFAAASAFNRGNTNLFFGGGRQWRLRLDDGTANTANGTILDDTNTGVASGDRDYQNSPGNWTNSSDATATPGEFDVGQILPVELQNFSAEVRNKTTVLIWSTASELNNDFMAIQASTDGKNFQEIGRVKGAGTTNEMQQYQLVHENPSQGLNYYRLLQVDYDGTATYSKVVTANFTQNNGEISIYPNPTTDDLTIKYPVNWEGETVISVLNGLGQVVKVITNPIQTFSVSDLPVGLYNLRITNGRQSVSKPFIKN